MAAPRRLPTLRAPAAWRDLDAATTQERAASALVLRYRLLAGPAPQPEGQGSVALTRHGTGPAPAGGLEKAHVLALPRARPSRPEAEPEAAEDAESAEDTGRQASGPPRRPAARLPSWLLAGAIVLGALQVMLLVMALSTPRAEGGSRARASGEPDREDALQRPLPSDAVKRMTDPVRARPAPGPDGARPGAIPAPARP